jgi:predicted AlkP superfamily phosphohydrolase/phosphomutase
MTRVLLIGLDSADADLIERWSSEGHLPRLAELRRAGAWGRLGTTADVMHVSGWPTLYTGVTPGRHGLYHAYQVREGSRGVRRARPESCGSPPFWKYLDDAGKRCLVFDAFMTYPLDGFGGLQILEYGTWTWFVHPGAQPPRLWKEIVRRFGPYPGLEHLHVLDIPDPAWFRDKLVEGARLKGEVVRWLLREQPWDMAFVTFGEPHGAGHYLWHQDDTTHPAHDGAAANTPHPLLDVYAEVDRAIGGILEAIDDDVTVIVVSGDGMGPNYAGCQHVPEVLHRLDLFHGAGVGGAAETEEGGARSVKPSRTSRLRKMIPLAVRQTVTRCIPRSLHYRMSMAWVNDAIDWPSTKVFCIPNANEAYLRVRLDGREPDATVRSGAEYEELLAHLERVAGSLRNPENGLRAAERIALVDELFPGPERPHLPDMVITWDPDAHILRELEGDGVGTIEGKAGYETGPFYTGNHRPNAFALARGPGVSAGVEVAGGHVLDVAPTVLALLGVDLPPHFEGAPWLELTS